jgi:DNA-binding FadR family transcriptional regulator
MQSSGELRRFYSMPVIQPLVVTSPRQEAVRQIEALILSEQYQAGDKLPPEQQLAESLQVGRRAVREALQALQAKGLVEVRMGAGTFVVRNDLDRFLNALSDNVRAYLSTERAELGHCSQFREIVEGAAIDMLAADPDSAVIDRLAGAVAGQEVAREDRDAESYSAHHFEFHKTIVDGLGNPIISMLFEQVLCLVQGDMETSGADPTVQREAIAEHRAVLDSIRNGNAESARKQLSVHLKHLMRNMDGLYSSHIEKPKRGARE